MERSSPEMDNSSVRKKVRTAPTNTSLLPPCKVCQEPAAGFHYGANTCEACKGFFRRSLLRTEPYKCLGRGSCNIRAGKRKVCPRCRHLKCLAVGMSKEAIKTGRYTHAKRTQDILEYQQMIENKLGSHHTATSVDHQSSGILVTKSPESIDSSQMASVSSKSTSSSQDSVMLDSVSLLDRPFELSAPLSPSVIADNMLDNLGRLDEAISPSSCVSSLSSLPPSSQSSSDSTPASSLSPLAPLSVKGGETFDDTECEKLVNRLLQSHKELVLMHKDSLSTQELHERQLACYEGCKLQTAMFGSMGLSDEEYLEVYKQTGLDVDNRQSLLDTMVVMLDEAIHRYIAFVKTIPGFSELSLADQIKLIKNNRCEFRMMSNFLGYNYKMKVLTLPSGRTQCIHELIKIGGKNHVMQRFECAHAIQKLGLSEEEMVILKCLMVVTQGNDDVDEPEKVSAVQWKMALCLQWLLKRNRCDANRAFARIMSGVCHIRELCVEFYEWVKTKPFVHYSQIQDNALLAEWFSNS